jgi:predicted metalloendopeptidase
MTLAGFDHADERARAVMALETAMAEAQATRKRIGQTTTTPIVYGLGRLRAPGTGMDWSVFFDAAGWPGRRRSSLAPTA